MVRRRILNVAVVGNGNEGLEGRIEFAIKFRNKMRKLGAEVKLKDASHIVTPTNNSGYFNGDVPTYLRSEVYTLVDKYVVKEKRDYVKEKFDKRYGEDVWGDRLPLTAVKRVLFVEHIEDLRK